MYLSVVVFVTLLGMASSFTGGINCPACDKSKCEPSDPSKMRCLNGYTYDMCGCCVKCAQGEGQYCGGFQNMHGTCGLGLYCKHISTVYDPKKQRYGFCSLLLEEDKQVRNDVWENHPESAIPEAAEEFHPATTTTTEPKEKKPEKPAKKQIDMDMPMLGEEDDSVMMRDEPPPPEIDWLKEEALVQSGVFNPLLDAKCPPPCTPQLCSEDKRAVCSATNVIHSAGNSCATEDECRTTSCLACDFVPDITNCGPCKPGDKRCVKKFGLCIKENRLKVKRDPLTNINDGVKFACAIPDCEM